MKKLAIILCLFALSSCHKDIEGQCGVVTGHDIVNGREYKLIVLFDDGKTRRLTVDAGVWLRWNRGERVCW